MWHVRYFGIFSQNEGKKRSSMMSGLSGFPVPMNTIAGDQLFRIARTSRVDLGTDARSPFDGHALIYSVRMVMQKSALA